MLVESTSDSVSSHDKKSFVVRSSWFVSSPDSSRDTVRCPVYIGGFVPTVEIHANGFCTLDVTITDLAAILEFITREKNLAKRLSDKDGLNSPTPMVVMTNLENMVETFGVLGSD